MATDEEILDILLQIRATGAAEAEAVNQIIANTGNAAALTGTQVGGLTQVQKDHAAVLQTLGGYTTTYGGALTAQEEHYARLQLSSKEFAGAERDITAEASSAARAMGALGSEGAHAMDRLVALGGTMSMGGPLGIGIGAAIVGIGAGIEVGKSFIDNADQQEAASRNLAAAYATLGKAVPTEAINAFITDNQKFLPNMYEAENAFASLARAGFKTSDQYRLINDAIDLSAAKHISLTDATNDLIVAHSGNTRALADLGISFKDIVNPQKDLEKATKDAGIASKEKQAADRALQEELQRLHDKHTVTKEDLMHLQDLRDRDTAATQKNTNAQQDLAIAQAEVAAGGDKFNEMLVQLEHNDKGARESVSALTEAHNKLSIEWDRLSNQVGPPLEAVVSDVVGGFADFIDGLEKAPWDKFGKGINDDIVQPMKDVVDFLGQAGRGWNALVQQITGTDPTAAYTNVAGNHGRGTPASEKPPPAVVINVNGVTDPQAAARAAQRAMQGALRT